MIVNLYKFWSKLVAYLVLMDDCLLVGHLGDSCCDPSPCQISIFCYLFQDE